MADAVYKYFRKFKEEKMRKVSLVAVFMLVAMSVMPTMGYNNSVLFNLVRPNSLSSGLEFIAQHRFAGSFTQGSVENLVDRMFGLEDGAHIAVGLNYILNKQFVLKSQYMTDQKEYDFGFSYLITDGWLKSQIDIQRNSFIDLSSAQKNVAGSILLSAESDAVTVGAVSFIPLVNLSYDGYDQHYGAGLGLTFPLFDQTSFVTEFFTRGLNPADNSQVGEIYNGNPFNNNAYSFGIKQETDGHVFSLFVTNTTAIGTRQNAWGVPDDYGMHLAFTISRYL